EQKRMCMGEYLRSKGISVGRLFEIKTAFQGSQNAFGRSNVQAGRFRNLRKRQRIARRGDAFNDIERSFKRSTLVIFSQLFTSLSGDACFKYVPQPCAKQVITL